MAKIDILQVLVLDHFGGAEFVPLDKYFDPDIMQRLDSLDYEEIMVIAVNGVYN